MLKKHLIFSVLVLFVLSLAGCGSGGGSSSSSSSPSGPVVPPGGAAAAGGGVVNHPVANAEIYWDQADGTALQVGSSNSEAVVNIDITKLPDSGYPIVLYIPAGAGVIKGTAKAYNTKLSTVLKSKPANGDNIYFTMFTSMIVSAFEKSGLDPDAAVAFAESRVKGVLGAMGMTSVDPLTTNPLTNDDLQLAQMTLWQSSGMALTDKDGSGDTNANIDLATISEDAGSIIDNIANSLLDNTKSPVTALTENIAGMTDAASIISSISSTAASEAAAIAKQQSYGDTQTVTQIQAELTAKATAAANAQADALKKGIGRFTADANEWRIDVGTGSGTVSKTFTFTAKNLNGANFSNGDGTPTATVTVPASSSLGTSSGTVTIDNAVTGAIALTTAAKSDLTVGTYQLTFTLTVTGTSNTATVVVPVTVYNSNTQRVVTDLAVTAVDEDNPTQHLRLIEFDSNGVSTKKFKLNANVKTLGTDSAGTYAVNFFPPSGTQFLVDDQPYGNFMRPLDSSSDQDISLYVDIKDAKKPEGKIGAIKAEVYKVGAEGTVLASGYAKNGNYVDFYGAGTNSATDLRAIKLLINSDGTNYESSRVYTNTELPNLPDGTTHKRSQNTGVLRGDVKAEGSLRLMFVTWAGDDSIDDVDIDSTSTTAVDSKYFKLFTDARLSAPRGGFYLGSTGYGNAEIGTTFNWVVSGSGSNGYVDLVGGSFDTPISGYKAVWGWDDSAGNDKDSNRDSLTVKMFPNSGYTASEAISVKSTGVLLQYPNSNPAP